MPEQTTTKINGNVNVSAPMTPEETKAEFLLIKSDWQRIAERMARLKEPIPESLRKDFEETGQRLKILEKRLFN
jgi:hypothetical protein